MSNTSRYTFGEFLSAWIGIVEKISIWVLLLFFVAVISCFFYISENLSMNTSTTDMLSPELEWRKLDIDYEKNFPQYTDNILVVIESKTPDQAIDAANKFYQVLSSKNELLKSVYYQPNLPFFKNSSLLYLDINELQDLSDNLATIQPFLSRLTEDQSLRGLFHMLSDALEAKIDGDDINLESLFKRLSRTLVTWKSDKKYRFSWHELMSGDTEDREIYREYIQLQPVLDYDGLFPGQSAITSIKQISRELGFTPDNGYQVRLTGSAALAYEEMTSVFRGTGLAIALAFSMVAIILLTGLRSMRLVVATLITLLTGLILTACFAALTVRELNLISVAFAVLYIGLGVDFAIHFCLRYRELKLDGVVDKKALQITAAQVGESLVLCAATTAVGFYAFMPTDYDGVAELGWISGSAMFISLFVTLTLLPALLTLFPPSSNKKQTGLSVQVPVKKFIYFPLEKPKIVISITLILVFISFILISRLSFDPNTLNLQSRENESVQTYLDLLADKDASPWKAVVLANTSEQARKLDEDLGGLDVVEDIIWLEDFIPEDQEEKLAIIEDMNLLLGVMPVGGNHPPPMDNDQLSALYEFNHLLKKAITDKLEISGLTDLHHVFNGLITELDGMDRNEQHIFIQDLELSLLETFPGRLNALLSALNADVVTRESLPSILSSRWISEENKYLLQISPKNNLMNNQNLREFVKSIQSVSPIVTGSPVVSIEAGDAVVTAFRQAFTYALIVIFILLLFLLSRRRDIFFVLTPLLLAVLFTGAICVLADIQLNFANIIALPLLLGIGVDSAIHILHRFRNALPSDGNLLATSSARAVIVSSLTTIFSIGNLAISPHRGTASMGILLTIGISMTLVCTLVIMPSLLAKEIKRES